MSLKVLFFFTLASLTVTTTSAAPFPAHLLLRSEPGLFWSHHGFILPTTETSWVLEQTQDAPKKNQMREWITSQTPLDSASYIHPQFKTARFRVEVEELKRKATLESYTKRWVKEYFQYGFRILATNPVQVQGSPAVMYDLLSKNRDVQLRQVIQVKNGKAVVLTCSDVQKEFEQVLPQCNRMTQNLSWR